MHLYDVHISETVENYAESQTIVAGESLVVVDTPFGKLGLAVCYDLRIPELFRAMLAQGMEVLAVFLVFFVVLGCVFWVFLVCVCVVVFLCYVVDAAQG